MTPDLPAGAVHILQALQAAGHEAFLVGGCVRDLLRGVVPHDWDVCTSALPEQTRACFPGLPVLDTGLRHGTVTVLIDRRPFEITTYRVDGVYSDGRRPDSVRFVASLDRDLARRDFTINAIAMSVDGALRDPYGGADDLRRRLIRCVGDPHRRFREDGLRLMRALRFAATLGYSLHPDTAAALHADRAMLRPVAAERVQVELSRLLVGPDAAPVLRAYPDVLSEFWPGLAPLLSPAEEWEHTLRALDAAPPRLSLRLAILLRRADDPAQLLRALKYDNATRRLVTRLTAEQGSPIPTTPETVRRALHRLGEADFSLLLRLWRAVALTQPPAPDRARLRDLDTAQAIADDLIARGQCFRLRDLAVDGRDVIAAGAPPGPRVGQVLDALLERVLSGEAENDRAVLLALIPSLVEKTAE